MKRDLSKLPKWAADEIRRLEANLKYAQEKLQALGAENPRVIVNPNSDLRFGLEADARVRFMFENSNGWVDVPGYLDLGIDEEDGVLNVYASDTVLIEPKGSNVLSLSLMNGTVDRENQRRQWQKKIHGLSGEPR